MRCRLRQHPIGAGDTDEGLRAVMTRQPFPALVIRAGGPNIVVLVNDPPPVRGKASGQKGQPINEFVLLMPLRRPFSLKDGYFVFEGFVWCSPGCGEVLAQVMRGNSKKGNFVSFCADTDMGLSTIKLPQPPKAAFSQEQGGQICTSSQLTYPLISAKRLAKSRCY